MIMIVSKKSCDECGGDCTPEKMLQMEDNAVVTSLKCSDCNSIALLRYEQDSEEAGSAFKRLLSMYGFREYPED